VVVNFSLGFLLHRRITASIGSSIDYLSYEELPYIIASIGIVYIYYRRGVRAAFIYVAFPLTVIAAGLFGFFAFGFSLAKYICFGHNDYLLPWFW
jgi:hypothetical protein